MKFSYIKYSIVSFFIVSLATPSSLASFEEGKSAYESGNFDTAHVLLAHSAAIGNVEAQYLLALIYFKGLGETEKNYQKAVHWFRIAAENGHAPSQRSLGYCYFRGYGVSQDKIVAVRWFELAAKQGHRHAQWNLGQALENGEGTNKDIPAALKWYEEAASAGHVRSQMRLATIYYEGTSVSQDYETAIKWFRKAASSGVSEALYSLAVIFETGQGVQPDQETALKYWLSAAQQGYAPAQEQLGQIYARGIGVDADLVEAYKWFSLAVVMTPSSDPDGIRRAQMALKALENKLSAEQKSLANQKILEWQIQPYHNN